MIWLKFYIFKMNKRKREGKREGEQEGERD